MRNAIAIALALVAASASAAPVQTRYYAREFLPGVKAASAAPTDQYSDVDVLAVPRVSPDWRETTTPATITMTCSNPSGGRCGGGGPLQTSRQVMLPVKYTLVYSGSYSGQPFEVWWPEVTAPKVATALPSICKYYASSIDNQLVGRSAAVIMRDADGNSVDNNCLTPAFTQP